MVRVHQILLHAEQTLNAVLPARDYPPIPEGVSTEYRAKRVLRSCQMAAQMIRNGENLPAGPNMPTSANRLQVLTSAMQKATDTLRATVYLYTEGTPYPREDIDPDDHVQGLEVACSVAAKTIAQLRDLNNTLLRRISVCGTPEELQMETLAAKTAKEERDAALQENRSLSRKLAEAEELLKKRTETITQLGNGMARLEERYNGLAEKHKDNIEEFHKMKTMRDEARAEVELLQQDLEEAREEIRVADSRVSERKSQDILFLVRRLRMMSERDV
jgi:myosin heavy subunit